ncbi:MAG: proprotein convertase P-domain-containing protein, partial [Saprospiraceae bacterium]|nr:proprotein convertase P-domain-containing protein [Saprospiraceae bacterium]
MKQLYKYLLLFFFFMAVNIKVSAQSDSCYNATAFCDSVNQYSATTNGPTAPLGNNYDCLFTQPNPTFFTLTVSQSGTIDITLLNTNNVDIDFILWGPYPNLQAAQSYCGNLGNGNITNGNVVDTCSYDAASIEYVQVSNAVAGSVYILMITNFSNMPTNIYSTSNSGTGSVACPCDINYQLDTLPFPLNQGFLTDTTTGAGQYVVCPGNQLGIQINAGGTATDTLQLYAPYTTINNVFPTSSIFTASGLNHDTISIGALLNPTQADVGTHTFDISIQASTPTNLCQDVIPIEVIVPGINLRDTTICSGNSILIPIDTFESTYVGYGHYQWTQIAGITATLSNDTLAQPTITAPSLGIGVLFDSIVLEVEFTYGGCITIDTITIIVIGIPDAGFNYPNTTYCQQSTNPTAIITGTPGGSFSSNTGVVFANTSTGEIDVANTPTGIHNIFYQLSSPGGQCDALDTFVLEIIGITSFEATSSAYFICPNELDTIQLDLNVTYSGTTPNNPSYLWSPNTNLNNGSIQNPIAILLTPDTFIVNYNDGVCDLQSDTISISSPYPISLSVSPPATVCNGGSVQIGASVAAGPGNQNFTFSGPTTLNVEDTTFVTLNVSGVAPSIINTALISAFELCMDLSVNAIGHLSIFLVAPSGETVQITNNHGGLATSLVNASFSTDPSNLSLAPYAAPFPFMPANSAFLPMGGLNGFNGLIGATTNGTWTLIIIHNNGGLSTVNGSVNNWCLDFQDMSQATFNWSPNYNISCLVCDSPSVSPIVDTTYMVIAQNAFGCIDTGFVDVTIDSALPAPIITCGTITPNSVTFNWTLVGGAAGYSISIDGGTPQNLPATQDSFQVTGLVPNQCSQIVIFALSGSSCQNGAPDSLTCCAVGCTTIDPIVIIPGGPTTFCVGQSVNLDAGTGFSNYLWSTSGTTQNILVSTTQLVSVTTTDAFGCIDTGSILIIVTPGPIPSITPGGPTTVCSGETVSLDAGAGFNSYAWSPAGNTQNIIVSSS